MPYITSPSDVARLFYVDYRPPTHLPFRPNQDSFNAQKNKTLFFIHGWPMSSRMYDHLMLPLSQTHGIRCIASDRRGFGRSEWCGPEACEITYETFARDILAIVKSIKDLGNFTFVGASMGCGESLLVYELMKLEGLEKQVQGFVWLGPSLPYPTRTDTNPMAPGQEVWDMILDGLRSDRVGFVKASIGGVFGVQNGVEMSESALEFYVDLVKQADGIAIERCCRILSTYDFTSKLEEFGRSKPADLPVLMLHGTKDQGMPLEASSARVKSLVPGSKLNVYEGHAHGLYWTARDQVLSDILDQFS